jgi:hypothetical protein
VKGENSLNRLSLSFSKPRLPGTSPLGLASLNRKDLPIVVTLGGVGPCYASLAFYFIAFAPSYKLCDNILAPLLGNTQSIFLNDKSFGKPCLKDLSLTSLPGDSTRLLFPFLW